jgi:Cys-rich repeat protein
VIRPLIVGVLLAAHDPSCGGTDTAPGGANAPCTRDRDCGDGFVCIKGVCADPNAKDAGDDGGDAATDAGGG